MKTLSELKTYAFGLEQGLFQTEELERFLDSVITTEANPPYVFIDAWLHISEPKEALTACINGHLCDMGYHASIAHWDEAKDMKKMLLRQIGARYRDGSFDLRRTTHELYRLAVLFEDYASDYFTFDDDWSWVEAGTEAEAVIKRRVDIFFDTLAYAHGER